MATGQLAQVTVLSGVGSTDSTAQLAQVTLSTLGAAGAPVVSVGTPQLTVDAGAPFTLTGSDSDTDGTVVARAWTVGGVTVGTTAVLARVAPVPGLTPQTLTYTYTCTDDSGKSASATATVTVRRAPIVVKNPDGSFTGRVRRLYTAAEIAATATTADATQPPRTVRDAIYGTRFTDGLTVFAADIGASSVQVGTGNTVQHLAAARMGALDGIRFLQPAASTSNVFYDFPDNTDPLFEPLVPWRFNADQVTGARTTFFRVYPDVTHGTVNVSLERTADHHLRILEAGTGGLDLTSTGTQLLPTSGQLMITPHFNQTARTVTLEVFTLGAGATGGDTFSDAYTPPTAPLFSMTGPWTAPFVVKSLRFGNGNGTSNPSMDTNNWLSWGRGIARPDLAKVVPSAADTGVFPVPLLKYPLTGQRGDLTITTGQTITEAEVLGRFINQAANVTLKDSLVRGPLTWTPGVPTALVDCGHAAVSNFLIKDTTIVPDVPAAESIGIDGHDMTIRRCDLYRLQDMIRMRANNCVLEDSWLHDFTWFRIDATRATSLQTHNDLIQLIDAISAKIRRNRLDAYYGPGGDLGPNGELFPSINTNTGLWGANNTHTESSAFMINIGTGTSGTTIEDNTIRGGYTPWNSGNNGTGTTPATRIWRNTFNWADKHGTPPVTIRLQPGQTGVDVGAGTVNANLWEDGPNVGQEVTVRYDG
jgi:hypothetical protein